MKVYTFRDYRIHIDERLKGSVFIDDDEKSFLLYSHHTDIGTMLFIRWIEKRQALKFIKRWTLSIEVENKDIYIYYEPDDNCGQ